jgi:hypothetical protein
MKDLVNHQWNERTRNWQLRKKCKCLSILGLPVSSSSATMLVENEKTAL